MLLRTFAAAAVAAWMLTGCGNSANSTGPAVPNAERAALPAPGKTAGDDAASRAVRIAREQIIVDTHVDVPYRVDEEYVDVAAATDGGDFDYPRAVAGGLNAPFMSIYTSTDHADRGESFLVANRLIDQVEALAAANPDKFAIALGPADVRSQFGRGLISLPMGMENGSPLEGKLENVAYFADRGIRYITLAHGKSNRLADSSYDDNEQWDGLSHFGAEVVREMNRLGVMVDVSHLSDAAFYDVLDVSAAPVIASHSSARHFTPGFERNMSDEMILALAENGGLIMINFGSSFITAEANAYSTARSDAADKYRAAHPELTEDEVDDVFADIYAAEHGPYPYATTDDVLDHFDHVVRLVGVDHLGIGSDYDGVGDSLPRGLEDVSAYPNLVRGLLERGYGEPDIAKILGENLLRVWATVEAQAAGS
ncbi:MAG TPA: dipeptidase [Woeseiaceae bacterium]|nr:dipeptidase [Woeseiaceae bacterium]